MLKTVSSITNAIGALNYKGTWNANTNIPTLASGVGTKGDYYVVGTAGATTLDGISNWGVGDLAVFNGSVWQRVEGGADVNGVNVTFTGTASGPTYETSNTAAGLTISNNDIVADGTDANINIDITPKGTGDVLVGSQAVNVADNQVLVSNTELLQIVTKACPTGAVTNLFSFDIPGPSAGALPYSKGMFRVHVAVNGDASHEGGGFQEVLIPYLAGDSYVGATANVVVNCSANFGVSKTITVTVSSRTVTVALDMAAYSPNHNKQVTCYIYNKDKTRTVTPL